MHNKFETVYPRHTALKIQWILTFSKIPLRISRAWLTERKGNVVFNLPRWGGKSLKMAAMEKAVATKNDEEIIIVSRFLRI